MADPHATPTTLKRRADDHNEVHDIADFRDAGRCVVTPVASSRPKLHWWWSARSPAS